MCLILVGLTELRRRLIWLVGATCTGGWAHGARHGTGTYGDREGVVYLGEYQPGGTASRAHPFGPRARAVRARAETRADACARERSTPAARHGPHAHYLSGG